MPDVIIWMISGEKRVAYYRMPSHLLLFSETEVACGKYCGKTIELQLKVLFRPRLVIKAQLIFNSACVPKRFSMFPCISLTSPTARFQSMAQRPSVYIYGKSSESTQRISDFLTEQSQRFTILTIIPKIVASAYYHNRNPNRY